MTHEVRESAKIIQFPVRARTRKVDQIVESNSTADLRLQRASGDASGGGWYHDAAIEESRRAPSTDFRR